MESILNLIWFRGSVWVIFKEMFLQSTSVNPWKAVIEAHSKDWKPSYREMLADYKEGSDRKGSSDDVKGTDSDTLYK